MAFWALGELIVRNLFLKETFVHTLLSKMLGLGMEASWNPKSPRASFKPSGMGVAKGIGKLPFRPKAMGLCLFKPKDI